MRSSELRPSDIAAKAKECLGAALATQDPERQRVLLHMVQAWLTLAKHYQTLGPSRHREYGRLADIQAEMIPTMH
jgi:hypothetical protein